jgi:hypothetical protein
MEIDEVTQLVEKHVNGEFAKLKSKNKMKFSIVHCGKWWVEDPNHPNYTAAAKAVEKVFGVKPDMTREGGSIPVTLTFQEELGKNVLLLPMGSSTDAAHSINEKLDKRNYIEGTKLLGCGRTEEVSNGSPQDSILVCGSLKAVVDLACFWSPSVFVLRVRPRMVSTRWKQFDSECI